MASHNANMVLGQAQDIIFLATGRENTVLRVLRGFDQDAFQEHYRKHPELLEGKRSIVLTLKYMSPMWLSYRTFGTREIRIFVEKSCSKDIYATTNNWRCGV
jgi:hypothetical protein